MKLQLRYKDYGTSEMGYPYSEDEIWWEKEYPANLSYSEFLDLSKKELFDYCRKEFSIDWANDTIEEKSEKCYTLNHLKVEVVNLGSVIDSWELKASDFIFNRDLVEIL